MRRPTHVQSTHRGPDRTVDPGDPLTVAVALSAGPLAGVVTAPLVGGPRAAAYPAVAVAVLVALVAGSRG